MSDYDICYDDPLYIEWYLLEPPNQVDGDIWVFITDYSENEWLNFKDSMILRKSMIDKYNSEISKYGFYAYNK